MQLKRTPRIGTRYWPAIMIASTVGTNFGDLLKEVGSSASMLFASAFGISLKLAPSWGDIDFSDLWGPAFGLVLEGAMLGAIFLMDSRTARGAEAFYWMAILVVRAVATNVADFGGLPSNAFHIAYTPVVVPEICVSAAVLVTLVTMMSQRVNVADSGDMPPANGLFWWTMLMAGVVGTMIGDWVRDLTGSMPCALSFASISLAILFVVRQRAVWSSLASYSVCLVAVRCWGTDLGDLVANGLEPKLGWIGALSAGVVAGGTLLTLLLFFWPTATAPSVVEQARA